MLSFINLFRSCYVPDSILGPAVNRIDESAWPHGGMGGDSYTVILTYLFSDRLMAKCTLEKIRQAPGIANVWVGVGGGISVSSMLKPMVLTGKVTFEQRPEEEV